MATAVNVFVKDTQLIPQPISGVVVNVYDSMTLTLVTSGTTNGSGQASFLLPGVASPGTNYELRFFKSGVIFTNPALIAVIDPPANPDTNDFDISGTVVINPVATDPRMCRCTGQFINYSGLPVPNTLVRILAIQGSGGLTQPPDSPLPPPWLVPIQPLPPNIISGFQVPKVLDGKMVSVQAMEFKTDANGRVSFDLIRNGQYFATFAGEEDQIWCLVVPDRSSANLIDLIHPEPVSLTWDPTDAPGNAVSVAVGDTGTVKFSVLFSNFITYAKNLSHVLTFTNSDGDVAEAVYDASGQIAITGIAVGTTNVTVAVKPNMTPARIPTYAIAAAPLVVTITP